MVIFFLAELHRYLCHKISSDHNLEAKPSGKKSVHWKLRNERTMVFKKKNRELIKQT